MPAIRVSVAVVEESGRFLVGRRPADVPLAGYWEFPGGKVGPGETPEQAAARECLEETGLQVAVGRRYASFEHQYDDHRLWLEFFACRPLQPGQSPSPPFCWVAGAELADYRFPEANRPLIEQLLSKFI